MKKYSPFWMITIFVVTILSTFMIWDWSAGKCRIQLGLDLRSGSHIAVQLLETKNPTTGASVKIDKTVQEQAIQVFQKRLNPDGTREIVVTPEPPDRLIIEIPEMTNLQEAESMVRKAARLEFREQSFDPAQGKAVWKTAVC